MRIALIADIHGNATALDAALQDIETQNADQVICLGDAAANGPQPLECLQRLQASGCPIILGNTDEWLLSNEAANPPSRELTPLEATFYWCAEQLTPEDHSYLKTFLPRFEMSLDPDHKLLCFHGSPRDCREIIVASTPEQEVLPMFEGHDAAIFAGGHTHVQILRRLPIGVFINPGSIGFPLDREPGENRTTRGLPRAEYAIIDWHHKLLNLEFRQVPYDFENVRAAAQANIPRSDWWLAKWAEI